MTPEQLLGELELNGGTVVCDLEAGVGAVVRAGQADLVLVVVEPTAKSIEVGRRAAEIASERASVVVVANRVSDETDFEAIRATLGDYELVVVPEDPTIAGADREGAAPIDLDPDAPGVSTLVSLAERLAGGATKA